MTAGKASFLKVQPFVEPDTLATFLPTIIFTRELFPEPDSPKRITLCMAL